MARITRERAELIAKTHACTQCQEYSYRKLTVKVAPKSVADELGVAWIASRICGVCGHHGEIGIQDDGDIVFES